MSKSITHKILSFFVVFVPLVLAISVFCPKVDFGLPKISYGIDLVGGGQIVLQVDSEDVESKVVSSLTELFKSHQLSIENSSEDSLVFFGDSLHPSVNDEFLSSYPSLSIVKTPLGFIVNGLSGYIKSKTGQATLENIGILRTRLNGLGVADITVYRQGSDKIVVEVPAGNEIERIKSILSSSAEIGFYEQGNATDGVNLSFNGYDVIRSLSPIVKGTSITRALANIDQTTGLPIVSIQLNDAGGKSMSVFTSNNIGKPIITTLTDSDYSFSSNNASDPVRTVTERVVSVATVSGAFSDSFMISGIGSSEETENLALILRSGALSAPMFVVSESSIDSRLGAENATQGFTAFIIGMAALGLYVIYLYQGRGVFSIITLTVNAALIIISLSVLGASLTMTGLAGLVLTMGMAVDANIIVIEREKELMGNSLTPMLDSFKSSALPILDANATTLLVAVILYNVSSVALKGFAITLALGVVCTVVSSYFINMYLSTSWLKEKTVNTNGA